MKIATSLCLGLALFSPAFALRGRHKRRAQELDREAYDEAAPLLETGGEEVPEEVELEEVDLSDQPPPPYEPPAVAVNLEEGGDEFQQQPEEITLDSLPWNYDQAMHKGNSGKVSVHQRTN